MSGPGIQAVRDAAKRVAREKREREHRPGDAGRLAGQYRGKAGRWFTLVWIAEECGYQRHFRRDSAWTWADPTIYAAAEIRDDTRSALWTASVHDVVEGDQGPTAQAGQGCHQKTISLPRADPTGDPEGTIGAPIAQSEKFTRGAK